MKIKRTNHGTPSSSVQGRTGSRAGVEPAKPAERKDVSDTVTLSVDALSAGGAVEEVHSVNEVQAETEGDRGPLPDPRETGRAILEKELAGVFREIYL